MASTGQAAAGISGDGRVEPPLVYTVHPAANHPVKTAVVLAVIGMITGGIFQATGELVYCAVAAGVFMTSLSPYFLPTTIIMDASGVTRKRMGLRRFLAWREIRGKEIGRRGIYLSVKRQVSWLDFRGIYIIFDRNEVEREKILGKIREQMEGDPGESGAGVLHRPE